MVDDQKQWNNFLLSQPSQVGIFLQSWEWGEFQKAVGLPVQISASQKFQSGRKVYRFASGEAQAQVVEMPLPLEKKYWYIPRGSIIAGLVEEARKSGVLFVRCEPITGYRLQVIGYRKTRDISPAQTLVVDLTKSEDELLAAMHEKTRYNIRLALRKGVKCDKSDRCDKWFEEFWKLMEETAKRDKFRTHPRGYYEKMLSILQDGDCFVRFHATHAPEQSSVRGPVAHESKMIAAAIVAYFGDTATYLHGASSYAHRALMGPYALHWEIMRQAKARGYKFYDFWGINTKSKVSDWAGMTRFKTGFGGQVVDYPGTFDLPLGKFWYTLYRTGRPLLP